MRKHKVSPPEGDRPLRAWRIEKGMRLEDVAEKIGCSVATLSRIETGISKRLDPDTVTKIKKLTGLGYDQLV